MPLTTTIRVAFLIRRLDRGGAERQPIALAGGLDKRKFDVTILTFYEMLVGRVARLDPLKDYPTFLTAGHGFPADIREPGSPASATTRTRPRGSARREWSSPQAILRRVPRRCWA